MLNRDFSNSTLNIIRATRPNIEAPAQQDYIGMIRQAGKDFNEGMLTKQMIDEHPEDKALIRQMGGSAYADMLKEDELRAEERQQKLDDIAAQRDFQREMMDLQNQRAIQLENMRHNNAMGLAQFKASLANPIDTNAQRNVGAMIEAGYTPQEAWAMYYGGNNPTLNMANLGQKGQEAYDKKEGERFAEKTEALDLLNQTQSAYDDMFSKDGLVEQAQIGAGLPDTIAGRIGGVIDRAVPTTLVTSDAQKARQQIQYLMGGLRLNEASAMKGALSDSEQKFLSDMVAGNVKGYSPYEMQGAFEGIINKLKRKAGVPSLKQFNQTPTDWSKASNEDLMKGL